MANRRLRVLDPTKFRGAVNPKLRALMQAKEYRDIIALLSQLENEGLLDEFLTNAQGFWDNLDIFELMGQEKMKQGGVLNIIRKEWPRLWPSRMDSERMAAFEVTSNFLQRLDASRLVDIIFEEVLPDIEKGANTKKGQQKRARRELGRLTEDERRKEIMTRLGDAEIIKQYITLCAEDNEVQSIAPKVAPFMAQFMSVLERKAATQTLGVGKLTDFLFFGFLGLCIVVIVLTVTGVQPPWAAIKTDVGKKTASYDDFLAAAEKQSGSAKGSFAAASFASLVPQVQAPPTTP